MPNTYTQIFIHLIFAVKGRESLIKENFKDEIEKYITGIIQNRNHKLLAIYCMPDHCHILISQDPNQSLSDLVREIKSISSKFINERYYIKSKFNWQNGYGAFSYSKSQLNKVIQYINNQKKHHKKRNFREEYLEFLRKYEIKFDDRYLFEWID